MATTTSKSPKKVSRLDKFIPWLLVVGGTLGLIFSGILTYEHNQIAMNPHYIPSCNLNPVIACGSVIASKQAQAFNIPNPWIGLAAFAIILTTGMAMLAGAKFKRWYWIGLELGTVFGLLFVHWLFFETVYRIHALCPYCIGVWIVTIATFFYVSIYNVRHGNIKFPKSFNPVGRFIDRHNADILVLWYLVIFLLILNHFWYYYGKHFL